MSNFSFYVSRNNLKALALFSGRKDIRYNLCGININAKNKALQATDGHRALRISNALDVLQGEPFNATIPIYIIDTALKSKSSKVDIFKVTVDSEAVTITINGQSFTDKLVQGDFPDVCRVLPVENSNDADASCHFNPDCLSEALKACKLVFPNSAYYCAPLKQSKDRAAYYYRDDMQIVIMPLRETHKV